MTPYPTEEEVEAASLDQLKTWYETLPLSGTSAKDLPWTDFLAVQKRETAVMMKILKRIQLAHA